MEKMQMKLSPPWITFVSEIKAMFGEDPEIKITYDEDTYTLKLYVDNTDKAEALAKLIPDKKEYGNVVVKVEIIPADSSEDTGEQLFKKAFAGNPVMKDVVSFESPFGVVTYAVFEKKVVQFYNDQMDDINGNRSTLFQEIAKNVFGTDHEVFYCTEADAELTKPLGEWP